jgi:hypothetical protein
MVEWWADDRGHPDAARSGREIVEERAAFLAQREPWRLLELTTSTTIPDTSAVAISWAGDAVAVLRGQPPRQHVVGPDEVWGDLQYG